MSTSSSEAWYESITQQIDPALTFSNGTFYDQSTGQPASVDELNSFVTAATTAIAADASNATDGDMLSGFTQDLVAMANVQLQYESSSSSSSSSSSDSSADSSSSGSSGPSTLSTVMGLAGGIDGILTLADKTKTIANAIPGLADVLASAPFAAAGAVLGAYGLFSSIYGMVASGQVSPLGLIGVGLSAVGAYFGITALGSALATMGGTEIGGGMIAMESGMSWFNSLGAFLSTPQGAIIVIAIIVVTAILMALFGGKPKPNTADSYDTGLDTQNQQTAPDANAMAAATSGAGNSFLGASLPAAWSCSRAG